MIGSDKHRQLRRRVVQEIIDRVNVGLKERLGEVGEVRGDFGMYYWHLCVDDHAVVDVYFRGNILVFDNMYINDRGYSYDGEFKLNDPEFFDNVVQEFFKSKVYDEIVVFLKNKGCQDDD